MICLHVFICYSLFGKGFERFEKLFRITNKLYSECAEFSRNKKKTKYTHTHTNSVKTNLNESQLVEQLNCVAKLISGQFHLISNQSTAI